MPEVKDSPYGIERRDFSVITVMCTDSTETAMSKEFATKEEALAFVEKGKTECDGSWECNLTGWEIKSLE